MKLLKENVKRLGFIPKGTYDAEIMAVVEYIDHYENEIYWLFGFKIIQKDGFVRYDYCLKYSEDPYSEFADIMMLLRHLLGKKPDDLIGPKELSHTYITLEIGYDIELVRTIPKKAIFRNYIVSITKPKNLSKWFDALEKEYAKKQTLNE